MPQNAVILFPYLMNLNEVPMAPSSPPHPILVPTDSIAEFPSTTNSTATSISTAVISRTVSSAENPTIISTANSSSATTSSVDIPSTNVTDPSSPLLNSPTQQSICLKIIV